MDARLRYLLRTFAAEPSEQNAMQLAVAMTRAHPQPQVRTRPLTAEEISHFPLDEDGNRNVEGLVRLNFSHLWDNTNMGSSMDFETYLDAACNALVGNLLLMNVTIEIVDVEPGEILIVEVTGDIEGAQEDEEDE